MTPDLHAALVPPTTSPRRALEAAVDANRVRALLPASASPAAVLDLRARAVAAVLERVASAARRRVLAAPPVDEATLAAAKLAVSRPAVRDVALRLPGPTPSEALHAALALEVAALATQASRAARAHRCDVCAACLDEAVARSQDEEALAAALLDNTL